MAWTVSFEKSDLTDETREVLNDFEFEEYGPTRIDMDESEFFSYKDALENKGLTAPADGLNSWAKGGI